MFKTYKFQTRGIGVITTDFIKENSQVGIYFEKPSTSKKLVRHIYDGWFETSLLGRYVNHSNKPNCIPLLQKSNIVLISVQDILPNHEITINYFDIVTLLNLPDSEITKHGIKDYQYVDENIELIDKKLF